MKHSPDEVLFFTTPADFRAWLEEHHATEAELYVGAEELRPRSGWELKPEGVCRGELCVSLPGGAVAGESIDARVLAERLGMPLVRDEEHDLWALGPATLTGRALASATAPELVLPDLEGTLFALSSLRGQKTTLVAWAPW